MKIIYRDTDLPFDKPKAEALAMIAAGLAEAYVEPAPVRRPDAQFGVHVWAQNKQPYIAASCSGCGNKAQFSGPPSHKTAVFRHCGIADSIPSHIAEEYAERLKKWKPIKKEFVPEYNDAKPEFLRHDNNF
jgi:hypothetical protein